VPSTAISEANKEVEEVMARDSVAKKRGSYQKYTPKQKATIGNYTLIYGTSAALRRYAGEFPDLKYTTVCEWSKVILQVITPPRLKNKELVELIFFGKCPTILLNFTTLTANG